MKLKKELRFVAKNKTNRKQGRRKLYKHIIWELPDHQCFSPAMIAHYALKHNLIENRDFHRSDASYQLRIRTTLARFAATHMPAFDRLIRIKGQAMSSGWFGWRWKQAYALGVWPQIPPTAAESENRCTAANDHACEPPTWYFFADKEGDEDDYAAVSIAYTEGGAGCGLNPNSLQEAASR